VKTKEYFKLWEQKNILCFGSNYVLYEYMYGTYPLLLRVHIDTDTRFKLYDDECDKTPVCKSRTGGKELSFNW